MISAYRQYAPYQYKVIAGVAIPVLLKCTRFPNRDKETLSSICNADYSTLQRYKKFLNDQRYMEVLQQQISAKIS